MPFIYRRDLPKDGFQGGFLAPTVGFLRDLLNSAELPDDWELTPNKQGNLSVWATTTDHPSGFMRHYLGYVDLVTGEVHIRLPAGRLFGSRSEDKPGHPEQNPRYDEPIVEYVDRVDFETSREPVR